MSNGTLLIHALTHCPVAAILVETDGRILYANPALQALTGLNAKSVDGAPVAEAFPGTEGPPAEGALAAVEDAVARGREWHGEIAFGETGRRELVDVHPLPGEGGQNSHAVIYRHRADGTSDEAERARQYAFFAEKNPDPVARLDESGRIILANQAARSLFGEACHVGKLWSELVPESREMNCPWNTSEAMTEDATAGHECTVGECQLLFRYYYSSEHRLCNVYGADITQQKRQADELRRQRSVARELLRIVSHDLRSSFAGVVSGLDLLEESGPDERSEYMDLIRQSARNGLELIELVRDLRRAEDLHPRLEPVELRSAVGRTVALVAESARRKGVAIDTQVPEGLTVLAEPVSLVNSVLANVFSNAIKFSYPNSAVRVTVRDNGNEIALEISDVGVGIPADKKETLFDVHRNESTTGTSGELGTGFGMPIMKRYMEAYRGRVEVSSRNDGTQVTLRFTRAHPGSESPAATAGD